MQRIDTHTQAGNPSQKRCILVLLAITLVTCLVIWAPSSSKGSSENNSSAQEGMPNVVFVWVDTLRADSLGIYGYNRNTSPNIDMLAGDSTVFMNNYTPHTVTLSSFMSIITGLYPFSHGVLHIAKDQLSPRIKTFAEILKLYGYSTSWYGPLEDPHLDPKIGFGRGFDSLNNFDDPNLLVGTSRVLAEIEAKKGRQFFINLHTYHVHAPYIPSEKYRFRFTDPQDIGILDDYDSADKATVEEIKRAVLERKGWSYDILEKKIAKEIAQADLFHSDPRVAANNVKKFMMEREIFHKYENIYFNLYLSRIDPKNKVNVQYAKALYDAGILEFDTEVIGPLVAKLKALDLYDNTMIIICSDHGEEFGEHGGVTHGKSLYNEVTWVPLIIKMPGQKEGRKIEDLSQTVDIMPTVLELLGIDPPHHVQGKSFAPLINNTGTFKPRQYAYGQMPFYEAIWHNEMKLCVFKGYHDTPWPVTWKNKSNQGKKELFNVEDDPAELNDLYLERFDVSESLQTTLNKWRKSLKNYQDQQYEFKPNIDEQTKEKIKKTGYW